MQVLEKSIEGKIVKWLKKNKIKWKRKAAGELLDRWILLSGGKPFILELKRPEGTLSRRQINEIKELRELGYDVEVHDNATEAIIAIEIRMEATRLSKEGDQVHAAKLLRGSLLRSRAREDKYKPRRSKDTYKRKANKKGAHRGSAPRVLFSMAEGSRKVGRL